MSVFETLEKLEETSGRLDKEALLEIHVKNEMLKSVFVAALDPYTVYYVNKVKPGKPLLRRVCDNDTALLSFLKLLSLLSIRAITGNDAKAHVESHLADMDALQQKWCTRILLKNLRVGVQESTLNHVWPGLVKSFAVSLAETLKSNFVKGKGIELLDKVTYPVRVEPKLDGLRCIAVKQNGDVTFYTRNGTVLDTPGLANIKITLEAANFDNVVLDGEMLSKSGSWNDTVSSMMKGRKS